MCAFCSTSRMVTPSRVDLVDGAEDLLHEQRGQAEGGLVEQQQPRPGHQRAGDGQHLLLAARERAGRLLPRSFRRGKSSNIAPGRS